MTHTPRQITLDEWDARYAALKTAGLREPFYGGPLRRHVADEDTRLLKLRFDNSPAALRLWNFLLTEEDRLRQAREEGRLIVGAMKDLGTVAVMAFAAPNVTAFYPDGAWWIPCVMEQNAGLLEIADSLGVDGSFCPVRAMLGAFSNCAHFPIPDLLICSVGATCDDFSAIAQRVEAMGHPILWWEAPHRRQPDPGEEAAPLPGGFVAPASQVAFVRSELERVHQAIANKAAARLDDAVLAGGIKAANRVRRVLKELRWLAYTAEPCPMPALEMLIAEMLAIHFCSDREESLSVLTELLDETRRRVKQGIGPLAPMGQELSKVSFLASSSSSSSSSSSNSRSSSALQPSRTRTRRRTRTTLERTCPTEPLASTGPLSRGAIRVFWVNPVADLRMMNLLEECGGRICGTEYLFCHALDEIPEDLPPLEALARMALADPMVGPASDRAARIVCDVRGFGAEALVISRIPGASHCATEGAIIGAIVRRECAIPVVELETPPLLDSMEPTLRTRLEAVIEAARDRRSMGGDDS